jgi:hypothetical protein
MITLGNIKDKMAHVFNSVKPKTYDIRVHIDELHAQLLKERDVASLVDHPGWQIVAELLYKSARNMDNRIAELAERPEKHRDELIKMAAARQALLLLIGIPMQNKIAYEKTVEEIDKRLNTLEEITNRAGLDVDTQEL